MSKEHLISIGFRDTAPDHLPNEEVRAIAEKKVQQLRTFIQERFAVAFPDTYNGARGCITVRGNDQLAEACLAYFRENPSLGDARILQKAQK